MWEEKYQPSVECYMDVQNVESRGVGHLMDPQVGMDLLVAA